VLTAYTLVFGGLMLLGGLLADLAGARRLMLTGLAVFTSATCWASSARPTAAGRSPGHASSA
jgi:MFS family permease